VRAAIAGSSMCVTKRGSE